MLTSIVSHLGSITNKIPFSIVSDTFSIYSKSGLSKVIFFIPSGPPWLYLRGCCNKL